MNRSGYAVRCLAERHGLAPSAVLVVFDEVALPLGRIRLRPAGGAGGHRGMESVIENLRSDEVSRLRLGVGPAAGLEGGADLSAFVLAPFEPGELAAVEQLVQRAADAIESWRDDGVEAAMRRFNG
jgi:PTH1 family peptidyl-tRNA hydrolase